MRQLSAEQKQEMLHMLAANGLADRTKRRANAEDQLRRLFLARGVDWDALSNTEKEERIDDLIHEDRPCAQ